MFSHLIAPSLTPSRFDPLDLASLSLPTLSAARSSPSVFPTTSTPAYLNCLLPTNIPQSYSHDTMKLLLLLSLLSVIAIGCHGSKAINHAHLSGTAVITGVPCQGNCGHASSPTCGVNSGTASRRIAYYQVWYVHNPLSLFRSYL